VGNVQPTPTAAQSSTLVQGSTTTTAAAVSVPFSNADQAVPLSATVTSPAGTVNEGTETFTILSGATPVGSPVTVSVAAGAASASYTLPGGTPAGTYTIQAVFNGTTDFGGSSDSSQSLTVISPGILVTGVSVGWAPRA
jgi:hypothetical protein